MAIQEVTFNGMAVDGQDLKLEASSFSMSAAPLTRQELKMYETAGER
jgi:hypothetical protein